jgi:hypothetical protein
MSGYPPPEYVVCDLFSRSLILNLSTCRSLLSPLVGSFMVALFYSSSLALAHLAGYPRSLVKVEAIQESTVVGHGKCVIGRARGGRGLVRLARFATWSGWFAQFR